MSSKLGRYTLLGRLGRGAMAEVFAARLDGPLGFSKRVAIKCIHPHLAKNQRFRDMLVSEARLAAVFEHANIAHVYELLEEQELLAMVMEYADGGSLRALLNASREQGKPIPWAVIATIGKDVCAALTYAHGLTDFEGRPMHISHRDLSPENILLTRSSSVKVTDFGLANARGQLARGDAAAVAARAEYMPREQYLGLPSDGRVDVFALGAVLYELAAAQAAFPKGTEYASAHRQRPAPLSELRPELPRALIALIEGALEEDAALRPTAEELGARLGQVGSAFSGAIAAGALGRYVDQVLPVQPLKPLGEGGETAPVCVALAPAASQGALDGPQRLTVGREGDVAALGALFEGGARVVTVVGAPGVGKTHFAQHFAATQRRWKTSCFIPLGQARGGHALSFVVARVLGTALARDGERVDDISRLGHALSSLPPSLVVLDGCEALIGAVSDAVHRWQAMAPSVAFLITSGQPLKHAGEVVYELAPLPVAQPKSNEPSPAARLFVEAARRASRDFGNGSVDVSRVERLVARLEGLPMAIELAAAQLAVLSLEELERHLAAPPTQRRALGPLREQVEEAILLLPAEERRTLGQLAVFRGGFDVPAAEAVVRSGGAPRERSVAEILEALVDKSLLRRRSVEPSSHRRRYDFFEVVREQALGEAERESQADAALERHARYFLWHGRTWAAGAHGHMGATFRRTISDELENLLSIHQRALEALPLQAESASAALAASLVLDPVLSIRGPMGLALSLFDSALAISESVAVHPVLRAQALLARGKLLHDLGRLSDAERDFDRTLALALDAGDRRLEAGVRASLGILWVDLGRHDVARVELSEALVLARRNLDRRVEALALGGMGLLALEQGRLDDAQAAYSATKGLLADLGDERLEAIGLGYLGNVHLEAGRIEEARACHRSAIELLEAVGDARHAALFTGYLGIDALMDGGLQEARRALEAARRQLQSLGEGRFDALFGACLGVVMVLEGDCEGAEATFVEAEEQLARLGDPVFRRALALHRGHLTIEQEKGSGTRLSRMEVSGHWEALAQLLVDSGLQATDNDVRLAAALLQRVLLNRMVGLQLGAGI